MYGFRGERALPSLKLANTVLFKIATRTWNFASNLYLSIR